LIVKLLWMMYFVALKKIQSKAKKNNYVAFQNHIHC